MIWAFKDYHSRECLHKAQTGRKSPQAKDGRRRFASTYGGLSVTLPRSLLPTKNFFLASGIFSLFVGSTGMGKHLGFSLRGCASVRVPIFLLSAYLCRERHVPGRSLSDGRYGNCGRETGGGEPLRDSRKATSAEISE